MTDRTHLYAGLLGLTIIVGGALIITDLRRTKEMLASQEKTQADEAHLVRVDAVRLQAEASAAAARIIFRRSTDTVLTHLTDTVVVKEFVRQAVETVRKDSIALVADSSGLAARDTVIADVKRELRLALARPAPRITYRVARLYDPIAARYSASGDASFRVAGGLALIIRVDAAIGQAPRPGIGIALSF